MKTARGQTRRAFTLIELLLAAAAGALILAVLVTVYGRAIHLRNQANDHTREARLQARAVQILRRDLLGARLSGGAMSMILESGATATHSRFPGDFRFTTTSASINEETLNGDLQEVEYYITSDVGSGNGKSGKLVRTVTSNVLATTAGVGVEEPVLSGVESMDVAFYDGSSWQSTWTVDPDDLQLPAGLRVTLTLSAGAHPATTRKTVEVLVPWTTQASIEAATTSTTGTGSGTGGGTGTGAGGGTGSGGGAGAGGGTGAGSGATGGGGGGGR